MPSRSSRSRSRESVIRHHPSNPRASMDSRVGNVVIPPDSLSIVTRSAISSSPSRRSRSRSRSISHSRGRSHSRSHDQLSMVSSRRSRRSRSRSGRRSYRSSSRPSRRQDRSRSRSPHRRRHRSSSSDRSRASCLSLTSDAATVLSRDKVRSLRSLMLNGLSPTEAKALREVFNPKYEGSFTLQCPILDESMGRTLKRLEGSSGSVIDFVEKTWFSTHYKILDIARPLIQLWGSLLPADP